MKKRHPKSNAPGDLVQLGKVPGKKSSGRSNPSGRPKRQTGEKASRGSRQRSRGGGY